MRPPVWPRRSGCELLTRCVVLVAVGLTLILSTPNLSNTTHLPSTTAPREAAGVGGITARPASSSANLPRLSSKPDLSTSVSPPWPLAIRASAQLPSESPAVGTGRGIQQNDPDHSVSLGTPSGAALNLLSVWGPTHGHLGTIPLGAAPVGSGSLFPAATLSAGPITPASPTIDTGQSITLSTAASGGTPPYSYTWFEDTFNPGPCTLGVIVATGLTATTYTVSPTASTYYSYEVIDSSTPFSQTACSTWDLVAVDPTLGASPVTPGSPTIDAGQSVTLSMNPTGGDTPYLGTQWYSSSTASVPCTSGTAGPTATPYAFSPTTSTYYCYLTGDSSQGSPSASATSAWDLVTVNPALVAGAITPTSPGIDLGQAITLTANPSGGTTPYGSYQWFSAASCSNPISGATSSTLSVSPGVSATYSYQVSDSADVPVIQCSPGDTVTVNPALTVSPVAPASPTIDSGQSISLTATPNGGTAPISVQWYTSSLNGAGCATGAKGGTSLTYAPSPTTNTYYCYVATDSSLGSPVAVAASGWDQVTVNPALAASAPTPASPTIDGGQSITLTASPSGGTPGSGYALQWFTGSGCASPIAGATSTTYLASPSATTTFTYTVTDQAYNPNTQCSAGDTITVNPALSAGGITPTAAGIDTGQSILLTANPTGGTMPYSFQWFSGLGCAHVVSGATSATYTATPGASANYSYLVTDSAYVPVSACAGELVTVNPALVAGSITMLSPSIDVGQSITLTSHSSGGTTPYVFTWYASSSSGSACSSGTRLSGTSSTLSPSPSSSTYYCYVVQDSSDGTSGPEAGTSPWDLVSVYAPPDAGPATPSSPALDLGQQVTLLSHESGGVPSVSYIWYTSSSGGGGCSTGTATTNTSTSLSVSPSTTTYYCYVVTDSSDGNSGPESYGSAWDQVSVNPDLAAGPITPGSPDIHPGDIVVLEVNIAGGTYPFGYQWYAEGSCHEPIAGATGVTYSASPSVNTTYSYEVTDSALSPMSACSPADTVTVLSTESTPLTVSASANRTTFHAGGSVQLTAVGSGGVGSLTYEWALNGTNLSSLGTSTSFSVVLDHPGNYTFQAWVTDSVGEVAKSVAVIVEVLPAIGPGSSPGKGQTSGGTSTGSIFLPLVVLIALLIVALLAFFAWRRRARSTSASTPPTSADVEELAPVVGGPPVGYFEGVMWDQSPAEWNEEQEEVSYGEYTVEPEAAAPLALPAGVDKTAAATALVSDTYRPWTMKITAEGIQVEEVGTSREGSPTVEEHPPSEVEAEGVTAASPAPPVTSEQAYAVLKALDKTPLSLDGVREQTQVQEVWLPGLLSALVHAKLVVSGKHPKTGQTVYALTPAGRAIAQREAGPLSTEEPSASRLPVETPAPRAKEPEPSPPKAAVPGEVASPAGEEPGPSQGITRTVGPGPENDSRPASSAKAASAPSKGSAPSGSTKDREKKRMKGKFKVPESMKPKDKGEEP